MLAIRVDVTTVQQMAPSRESTYQIALLGLLLTTSFASGAAPSTAAIKTPARPHVVLIMSDDQGWGDTGYNGHPILKTPHLDAAAAAGLRLDRFYAAAPSCSPTRASVLTGRHPNRMGVFSWGIPIRPQEFTIAELLKQHGYRTGHFGKWHLGSVRPESPVNPGKTGFDRWVSAPNFFDRDPLMSDQGVARQMFGESSEVAVDLALEWMRSQLLPDPGTPPAKPTTSPPAEVAPLFVVIWLGSPHLPHLADPRDAAPYADQPKKLREYLGEVAGVDRAFGHLRDELQTLGIRENTLLWFCSDNGAIPVVGNSGENRGAKHSVYEGGLLVPAFIEWPAMIRQPRSTPVRCGTVDIFPTLANIVGASREGLRPLDGISLLPLLRGEMSVRPAPMAFWNANIPGLFSPSDSLMHKMERKQDAGREPKVEPASRKAGEIPKAGYAADQFGGHSAWIEGDWKLHRFSTMDGAKVRWELYNLAIDPLEKLDVSKLHPEVLKTMQSGLDEWLEKVVGSLHGRDYE
jgi:arylsulfatase A-like enzyme